MNRKNKAFLEAQSKRRLKHSRSGEKSLPAIANKPVPIHQVNGKKTYQLPIDHGQSSDMWAYVPSLKYKESSVKYNAMLPDFKERQKSTEGDETKEVMNSSMTLITKYFRRKHEATLRDKQKMKSFFGGPYPQKVPYKGRLASLKKEASEIVKFTIERQGSERPKRIRKAQTLDVGSQARHNSQKIHPHIITDINSFFLGRENAEQAW